MGLSPNPNHHVVIGRDHDLIIATGRSDYPNQVNNVLGFPFIFRGALDAGATTITQEMHIAAVHEISSLAKDPVPRSVMHAYGVDNMEFGPDYIIPKPVDPRLIERVPAAVAQAAIDSGVAKHNHQEVCKPQVSLK